MASSSGPFGLSLPDLSAVELPDLNAGGVPWGLFLIAFTLFPATVIIVSEMFKVRVRVS